MIGYLDQKSSCLCTETVISMDSVVFERRPMPIGRYHLKEMTCNEIGKLDLCENCSGLGGYIGRYWYCRYSYDALINVFLNPTILNRKNETHCNFFKHLLKIQESTLKGNSGIASALLMNN